MFDNISKTFGPVIYPYENIGFLQHSGFYLFKNLYKVEIFATFWHN